MTTPLPWAEARETAWAAGYAAKLKYNKDLMLRFICPAAIAASGC